jgi:Subtilase family/Secretion system C-terminal sorting domain
MQRIKVFSAHFFQHMSKSIHLSENTRRTTACCLMKQYFIIHILICIIIFCSFSAIAQVPGKKEKLAPGFAQRFEQNTGDKTLFLTITVKSMNAWKECAGTDSSFKQLSTFEPANTLVIKADKNFIKRILSCEAVLFADDVKQPKEELLTGFVDYATNNISLLHSEYPQYNGTALALSVKENKFDTTDIDFKSRIIFSPFAAGIVSAHASSMATIIAGGGNSWHLTKGAAWGSQISSATFQNLLPEPLSYYQQSNISLQNHSYGTLVEHFYGAEAAAYDASVSSIPSLLHIFSAGNSGTLIPSTGKYAGTGTYSNLTGNFKQAKNIITVGHVDSFYNVLAPSSRGPSFDGRMKPELVAFGEDGSSGAAALVSGIALTLQHAYKQLYGNVIPSAALIKAVLLNSADDVGTKGIDYASGFGNANGYKAMQTILKNRLFTGTVSNNTSQNFLITVPAGTKQLKLTLVWADPASAPNTNKVLVNDVDVELIDNNTLQTWLPWVLSSFPNRDSLQATAVRKKDTLNNAEQISIDNPTAGVYTIAVKGSRISTASQAFALAWQTDSVNTFKWYYPSKNDHLLPPDSNVLRWESNHSTSTGELQLSIDNGNIWQTISTNINTATGFYKYAPPSLNTPALLRMKIGTDLFVSDTFTISKRITTNVGFNCADSFLIQWQKVEGINQYRVYRLGSSYLEPFITTADTFLIQSKTVANSLHYAIAPLAGTKELVRSYTFNYNNQGTGCYIKSFVADLNLNNTAQLQLELGSLLRIKTISFEKREAAGFKSIRTFNTLTGLQYSGNDISLITSANIYRAVIELNDGRKFYSDEAVIYFNGTKPAVVYPNPALRNQPLNVLAKPEDQLTILFYNSTGALMMQQLLNDYPEQINISLLSKGIYYYKVVRPDKTKVASGTVVVQ